MTNTYWDKLEGNYHYEETLDLKILVGLLLSGESIFEASTGSGIIPTMLRKFGWKGHYLGSDYCDNFLNLAKTNNPDEEFIKVDLFKPIPLADKSWDYSVVHHGLEYVYPYTPALVELKRITKKNIFLVFWVEFLDHNKIRFTEEENWNVNYYDKDEFYKTLEDLGLVVEHSIEENLHQADGKQRYNLILKLSV